MQGQGRSLFKQFFLFFSRIYWERERSIAETIKQRLYPFDLSVLVNYHDKCLCVFVLRLLLFPYILQTEKSTI